MSKLVVPGLVAALVLGLGGCVVHGEAGVGAAEPPPPTVVGGSVAPVPAEGTPAEPTTVTVVNAPVQPVAPVPAEGTPAEPTTVTVVNAPVGPVVPMPAEGTPAEPTTPGPTVPPTVVRPPVVVGTIPPVTPPPDGQTLTVTSTTVGQPVVNLEEPLGIPRCSEEGSTTQCPSGRICAIGTDQAFGCRLVCQADANCGSNERCVPTARLNRSICLVR